MKPVIGVSLFAVVLLGLGVPFVRAQVPSSREAVTPGVVNYQGRLLSSSGEPYSNGVFNIEFRLWDAANGGNILWGGKYSAYVTDGYFNVMLGASGGALVEAPLAPVSVGVDQLWKALWFDSSSGNNNDRFLGIKVLHQEDGTEIPAAEAEEAFPRQRLLCSPFAERAQMAQYARQAIDEFSVPGVLTVDGETRAEGGLTVDGTLEVNGAVQATASSHFANGLTVDGAVADLNKGVDVDGGLAMLRGGADVTGMTQLRGGVTVTGDGQFNNNVSLTGDLNVGDDAVMDKLTLRGMGGDADAAIDYGGGYITYADSSGGEGADDSRLWIGTPANSEVVVGPRSGSSRLDNFRVKSDSTRFEGATVNFKSVNNIYVEGASPIRVRRFDMGSNVEDKLTDTGYSSSTWSAMMVGFDFGYGDIDEDDPEDTFMCRMEIHNSRWYIHFQGHYHGNYADPDVDVMFIRRELVDDNR